MPQVALRRDDQIRDAGGIQDSRLGTRESYPWMSLLSFSERPDLT